MSQKELKQKYAEILANEVWHGDQSMVDFCVKEAAYIVELGNGDIVPIKKPDIKKRFCFGYSDSRYDTEDYDRANAMADHARKSVEYFIKQNMADIDEQINNLEGKGSPRWAYRIAVPYSGQKKDSKLKHIWAVDRWDPRNEQYQFLEGEDLQRVIEGYKVVRAEFEKRLDRYLKRYGLSKVKSWSYWQDA